MSVNIFSDTSQNVQTFMATDVNIEFIVVTIDRILRTENHLWATQCRI